MNLRFLQLIGRQSCVLFALITLAWLTGFPAAAQTALTGGLRGTIKDQSGTVVAGAQVTLRSKTLTVKQEVQSDEAGRFTLLGLTPANDYEITVTVANFQEWTRSGITIVSEETAILDATLVVGQTSEIIDVNGTDTILPTNPEVSQVVDLKRLNELPSNGRNLNRFALLDSHVRNTSGLGGDGFAAGRLSINGNIYRETHYKLDGNANFDALFNNSPQQSVSISAVQEFKVLTNQYSAEYGGTSAGFLVATTKSGANEFHGETFFYGVPSGIQARPPLSTLRIPNQLLQFGASFGGPVVADKTFFFANFERTQQDRASFVNSPAPLSFVGALRDTLALLKLDHRFSDTHSLALRVNGNRTTNTNSNDRVSGLFQPSTAQLSVTQTVGTQLNDTITFGRFVNELRLSYTNGVPSNTTPLVSGVGIVRPGYSTEGASSFSTIRQENYQIVEQMTAQLGKHVVRYGVDVVRQKLRDFSFQEFGTYTFAPGPPQPNEKPTQFRQQFGTGLFSYGQTRFAGFIQDDWRWSPRLTVNVGLRYDYQSVLPDKNNFNPRVGFAFDVAGNGKTVVRGGAGVYYDQPFFHGFTQRFLQNGPTSPTVTVTIPFGAPGFPQFPNSLAAPPANIAAARRNLFLPGDVRSPYTTQVSLGVQHKFFGEWVASVDLIHSQSVKQLQPYDLNAPSPFVRTRPGQVRSVAEADATRPFSTFAGVPVRQVLVMANAGRANYNAADFGLSRRFASRYQIEAHYVYSSAINSITDDHLGANPNEWSDPVRGERGPSDFFQRHRFIMHGIVALPHRFQVAAVFLAASGTPVNALTGVDNNGDTTLADRPAGFSRNSFVGPNQVSLDLSVSKAILLKSEKVRLELRADAFNLFNRSNFNALNNVFGNGAAPAATFMRPLAGVSNVNPGRQFQFGARLTF